MDGLTITTAKELLDTGKTHSELRKQKFGPQQESSSVTSFGDTLTQAIDKVNDMQKAADKQMQAVATGEQTNISEVMIAAEKADIALKLMMTVRNKVIDAYQEVMKMQV